MTLPDSPPPVYSSLRGILPPAYTEGDGLADHSLYAFILNRHPSQSQVGVVAKNDDEEKTTGIEDMPTEILHSIICLACGLSSDDPDLLELRVSQATIFSCAGVSRKWMDVTACHKELWSRVLDFTLYPVPTLWRLLRISDPCLFNVGHRSAPVALSWADQSHRDVYGTIRLIYQFRSRIRELHVEWGFGGAHFLVQDLFQMEAPHLEVVTWHAKGPFNNDAQNPVFRLPPLPYKRLILRRVFILFQPTASLCLLTAISTYRSPATTLIGWVNVLRSVPKLRFLSIRSSIRFDGHIPAIPSDSVRLVDLVLLTIGSLTPTEAKLHLTLLGAIDIPPACGLHIPTLPFVHSTRCRAMLTSKIFKLMRQSPKPALALELMADQKAQFTMGTVRDSDHALDWAGLGEQRVLAYLRSSRVPVLVITTYSTSIADACKIYPQVISYFGQVTYDRVTSFNITISPFENRQYEEWFNHPCFEEFVSNLSDLFSRLHRVTSLSGNAEAVLAVYASLEIGQETVESARETSRLERAGKAVPVFIPDFPLLCNLALHANEIYSYAGTAFAREFIASRLLSGYPLCTAKLPPTPALTELDARSAEHILSYESKPVGYCRIIRTPDSLLAKSAYFEEFCDRT